MVVPDASANLLYIDALDSARTTDTSRRDREEVVAAADAIDHLAQAICVGDLPVLTETQVFDGHPVLAVAAGSHGSRARPDANEADAFLWMIREGYVQVRLFGGETISTSFASRLVDPDFAFSAWPEIERGECDRAELLEAATTARDLGHPAVNERLNALRRLSDAVGVAPSVRRAVPRGTLSAILEASASKAGSDDGLPEQLRRLAEYAKSKGEKRSALYRAIGVEPGPLTSLRRRSPAWKDFENIPADRIRRIRQIIDGAYNFVSACSLGVRHVSIALSDRGAADIVAGSLRLTMRQAVCRGDAATELEPFTWENAKKLIQISGGSWGQRRRQLAENMNLVSRLGDRRSTATATAIRRTAVAATAAGVAGALGAAVAAPDFRLPADFVIVVSALVWAAAGGLDAISDQLVARLGLSASQVSQYGVLAGC